LRRLPRPFWTRTRDLCFMNPPPNRPSGHLPSASIQTLDSQLFRPESAQPPLPPHERHAGGKHPNGKPRGISASRLDNLSCEVRGVAVFMGLLLSDHKKEPSNYGPPPHPEPGPSGPA
jgi:hypothetical protein